MILLFIEFFLPFTEYINFLWVTKPIMFVISLLHLLWLSYVTTFPVNAIFLLFLCWIFLLLSWILWGIIGMSYGEPPLYKR